MLLDRDPPRFPADWAVAWGEDAYGLWQAFVIGEVRQVMRWIPPGRFRMGSPADEPERFDRETPHDVTLSKGYWLAETACTQALWQAVTGDNPSRFDQDPENPVELGSVVRSFDPCLVCTVHALRGECTLGRLTLGATP